MLLYVFQLFACLLLCSGQNLSTQQDKNAFSHAIGNFSLELISHAHGTECQKQNRVLSPFYVWKVLAATAEGANGETGRQLNKRLRITADRIAEFQEIARRLDAKISSVIPVILSKFNGLFLDTSKKLQPHFNSRLHYDTTTFALDFGDGVKTADSINQATSALTNGRINKLVQESDFAYKQMIIASAVHFKGEWKVPFNSCSTSTQEFYDSNGVLIGEVNMMYNKYTYPFADIKELQAKVVELPCAGEKVSMVLLLPNPGVTLQEMFSNFLKVPLDTVFSKLKQSESDFGDHEIEIFIPRFKTDSNLDLKDVLSGLGVNDLFDPTRANLGRISSTPVYVNKVIHKAKVEVTEGTTPPIVGVDLLNINGNFKFNANRPFSYFVVEKETNSIILGGVYNQPILY